MSTENVPPPPKKRRPRAPTPDNPQPSSLPEPQGDGPVRRGEGGPTYVAYLAARGEEYRLLITLGDQKALRGGRAESYEAALLAGANLAVKLTEKRPEAWLEVVCASPLLVAAFGPGSRPPTGYVPAMDALAAAIAKRSRGFMPQIRVRFPAPLDDAERAILDELSKGAGASR